MEIYTQSPGTDSIGIVGVRRIDLAGKVVVEETGSNGDFARFQMGFTCSSPFG